MTPSPAARLVDWTLEASVVGSFTKIGYHTRRRLFDWTPLQSLGLDGKVAIVTGATSGLGRTAAESIAELGGQVCIVGRDPGRTERARSEISVAAGSSVEAGIADLSSLAETAAFAARFATRHDRLDVLVLNAGALTHEYTVTGEGNETTFATHVLSPFLLIRALRPLLEASASSRVILVASGGMYTEPLDVTALDPGPGGYDGTKAYARCKRAQVVLAEEWTRDLLGTGIAVNAMHPGWAELPGFGPRFPASAASWGRSSERRSRAPTRSSGWPPLRTPRTRAGCSSSTGDRGRSTACAGRVVPTRSARRRGSGGSAWSARPHSHQPADQPPDPAAANVLRRPPSSWSTASRR